MKFFLVLLFAGIALASAIPLQQNVDLNRRVEDADVFESETEKTFDEVKEDLKERVKGLMKKIKDVIETGKLFQKDTWQKIKELMEKFKGGVDGEKVKKFGDETLKFLKKLLQNFGSSDGAFEDEAEHADKESHGVISDYFQKVKDYFKELNIELHEKFSEFGHWVKEQYEKNLEKGKDKAESLKQIAREFLHDTRTMSKHMAVEAKFFFNEYSKELGDMFGDVMKKIDNVLEH